ncbi:MAG: DUF5110 domain-containing protein, partial [Gammaproteobacteria bacterium]|nr:DUF5110 domain-containing protein [Gammaproteobacteria bacterium]
ADTLTFEAVAGRTSYIVFAADNYPGLINNYVDVTGKQPLPPRWAFGHFISRFGYRSEWEVRDVVNRTLEAGIPADAVIIDLFWYGQDMKGNVGNFKWDEHTFPTYQEMLDDLKLSGIKTIVITEPFILGSSFRWQDAVDNEALVKNSDGKPYQYDFFFGNTGLIDVFDDNASQWFWGIYKDIFNQGVAGTWGDLGEPEVHPDDSIHYISEIKSSVRGDAIHNVYGQQWARLVYENQLKLQPDNRPFILMRSGFAGSQRYAMIPWTGDVSRSWGGLKPQVELSLSMGLLGLAYTHSDLGGFAGGKTFDQELYIRWLQYGVFQPIYRPHAQWQIPSEVALHDNKTKDIIRAFIKLRYRMLPYIYTLAYENATTGIPMMRPVFFEDETDASLFDITDAYLWGDSFFVSPVTEPNQSTQTIHLPKGIWFDFWSDKKYGGDQSVDIPVTLETIPVLVRAGSFVPMVGDIMNTEQYSSESMSLHYYADDSVNQSNGTMYEDDGKTHDSIGKKQFEILNFSSVHTADNLTIELSKSVDTYPSMPKQRKIKMVIHNWSKMPQKIVFANKEIPLLYGKEQDKGRETMQEKGQGTTIEEQQNTGYSFNAVKNLLTIHVQWDHEIAKLIVNPARGI